MKFQKQFLCSRNLINGYMITVYINISFSTLVRHYNHHIARSHVLATDCHLQNQRSQLPRAWVVILIPPISKDSSQGTFENQVIQSFDHNLVQTYNLRVILLCRPNSKSVNLPPMVFFRGLREGGICPFWRLEPSSRFSCRRQLKLPNDMRDITQ